MTPNESLIEKENHKTVKTADMLEVKNAVMELKTSTESFSSMDYQAEGSVALKTGPLTSSQAELQREKNGSDHRMPLEFMGSIMRRFTNY